MTVLTSTGMLEDARIERFIPKKNATERRAARQPPVTAWSGMEDTALNKV